MLDEAEAALQTDDLERAQDLADSLLSQAPIVMIAAREQATIVQLTSLLRQWQQRGSDALTEQERDTLAAFAAGARPFRIHPRSEHHERFVNWQMTYSRVAASDV